MACSLNFIYQIFNDLFSTASLAPALLLPPMCLRRGSLETRGCFVAGRVAGGGMRVSQRSTAPTHPPRSPSPAQGCPWHEHGIGVCVLPLGAWRDAATSPAVARTLRFACVCHRCRPPFRGGSPRPSPSAGGGAAPRQPRLLTPRGLRAPREWVPPLSHRGLATWEGEEAAPAAPVTASLTPRIVKCLGMSSSACAGSGTF